MTKRKKKMEANKGIADKTDTKAIQSGNLSAEQQEELLEKLQGGKDEREVHRLTVDIPLILYKKMSSRRKETGQTMRGLIIYALKKHFNESEE